MKRNLFFLVFLLQMVSAYELSICAIFKDEAPYLKEWIEFHKMQGVEHFFLYNNNSVDEYLQTLQPYIACNEITLVDWSYKYEPGEKDADLPWLKVQVGAYNDCISQYGLLTKWLAVIDVDEFLFCPCGVFLTDFLELYQEYGGVCVNWRLFGTSYIEEIPSDRLLIESLIRCAPKEEGRNHGTKSIVQPSYVIQATNAHAFEFKDQYFAVNTDFSRAFDNQVYSSKIFYDVMCIHHYWTRTERYFYDKKIPSREARRPHHDKVAMERLSKNYNECIDTTILQFVPKLRSRMY